MVTLQILVLPFLVRVRVPQQKKFRNPNKQRGFGFFLLIRSTLVAWLAKNSLLLNSLLLNSSIIVV